MLNMNLGKVDFDRAAGVILAQARLSRDELAQADFESLRPRLNEDIERMVRTLTFKWKGCIELIEALENHPVVQAAGIKGFPESYRLEKLEGPKGDEGLLLTETAQNMARAMMHTAIRSRLG